MKILLVNSNPVVSRLTALSARKENIEIDEVQEINDVKNSKYDIIFIDSDSWNIDEDSKALNDIKSEKKVLFHTKDDENSKKIFDTTILKPFLPSEVSAIIRSVEENTLLPIEDNNIPTLETSTNKKDKEDDFLLSLDDDMFLDEKLSVDTHADSSKINKIEDKDEGLFAELKDDNINDFDRELKRAFSSKREDEELFNLDLNNDDNHSINKEIDLFGSSIEKKNDKKIDTDIKIDDIEISKDDFLDFNLNSIDDDKDLKIDLLDNKKDNNDIKIEKLENIDKEEIIVVPNKKVEKSNEIKVEKIEKIEKNQSDDILNIKDILESDNDNSTFESNELLTPTLDTPKRKDESIKKDKKRKDKKVEDTKIEKKSDSSTTIIETLSSLPVDTLQKLLSGATIKISIKFPKVK